MGKNQTIVAAPVAKEEDAQEIALTNLAFVKIDGESDAEAAPPAPTTSREVAVANAFSKLAKLEEEDESCGTILKTCQGHMVGRRKN